MTAEPVIEEESRLIDPETGLVPPYPVAPLTIGLGFQPGVSIEGMRVTECGDGVHVFALRPHGESSTTRCRCRKLRCNAKYFFTGRRDQPIVILSPDGGFHGIPRKDAAR